MAQPASVQRTPIHPWVVDAAPVGTGKHVRLFGTMSVCVSARPPQPPTDEHNHPSVRLLPVNGAGRRYPCKPTASTTGVLHLSALCRNTAARGGVLAKLELNALGPISRILVDGSEPGAVVLLPRETKVRGRRPTTLVFVSIEYAPALTMLPIELLPPASCGRHDTGLRLVCTGISIPVNRASAGDERQGQPWTLAKTNRYAAWLLAVQKFKRNVFVLALAWRQRAGLRGQWAGLPDELWCMLIDEFGVQVPRKADRSPAFDLDEVTQPFLAV